jgi:hypothetical protein
LIGALVAFGRDQEPSMTAWNGDAEIALELVPATADRRK